MDLENEIKVLNEKNKNLTEALRFALMGDFEQARIWLDANDPERAGKWSNVPFPKE